MKLLYQNNASSNNTHMINSIHKDRIAVEQLQIWKYFYCDLAFSNQQFYRRFLMRKHLFMYTLDDLGKELSIFSNIIERKWFGKFQYTPKMHFNSTSKSVRGQPNSLDEYLNMPKRTLRESLQNFCYGVIQLYKA